MSRDLASKRRGEAPNTEYVEPHKAECGQAFSTPRSDAALPEETAPAGSPHEEGEAPIRIRVKVTLRRVRIEPAEKREEYIARLEKAIKFCENVLNNPGAVEEIQLEALDVIIRAIRMSYTIVKDVDVENLERLTDEVKTQLKGRPQPSLV